nr:hypothetical protein GW17_00015875 [Ipomoea trifida]
MTRNQTFADAFFPARIMEIWRPLLKAWLKSNLVWNSETNGNHDNTTVGMKMISPIMHSCSCSPLHQDSQLLSGEIPMPPRFPIHLFQSVQSSTVFCQSNPDGLNTKGANNHEPTKNHIEIVIKKYSLELR